MTREHDFRCTLPSGLHARPASLLSEVAECFASDVELLNRRTGAKANAKSVLETVAIAVKSGDACTLRCSGADAESAHEALREFVENVLPGCDEPAPVAGETEAVALPRALRDPSVRWLAGTIVCAGIGDGIAVHLGRRAPIAESAPAPDRAGSSASERDRARRAIAAVRAAMQTKLDAHPGDVEAGILRAHVAIAGDVGLRDKIDELVAQGRSAARAVVEAAEVFAQRMRAADSDYVRERAVDVIDIGRQLFEEITGTRTAAAPIALDEPSVVVSETLTPRELLSLDRTLVRALVLEHVGTTSHASILARSFDIPTLTGIAGVRSKLGAGDEALVDAGRGIVYPRIPPIVRRYYERERKTIERAQARVARHAGGLAETRDGQKLEIAANVSSADEVAPAFARGADGIGLYRTEMAFLDREAPPSEDDQLAAYAQAARAAKGRPVILRTFDVGGDKPVPYLHLRKESNPFLGVRGVRVYPEHRDVFRTQLRAILRASAFGKLQVMLPMVSTVDEVRWAKAELASVASELESDRVDFDRKLPLGVMVEVPSAALCIEELAGEVDFFSIGTNDLAQYVLAVDRESSAASHLYSELHPAFLRLLAKIATDARRAGKWVGMCGEMARFARNLPLLVALGLDEISSSAPSIAATKAALAELDSGECRALLERALACTSAEEVGELLASYSTCSAARALVEPDLVVFGSDSASKAEAIHDLVGVLHAAGRAGSPHELEEAVWAREEQYSTGLGHGFAIPHCKSDAIAVSSIAVARLAQSVDWGSLDGEPVHCVILLAMRASAEGDLHMKVFAQLARKLMHEDFRSRILAAADREGLLGCLTEELDLAPC
jgi:fructose-specific PTS system IIA-like component